MNLKVLVPWLLLIPGLSQAINVGAVTTFIDADSQEIAKQIENGSDQARLVTITVTRISSPEEGGEEIPMEVDGELMLWDLPAGTLIRRARADAQAMSQALQTVGFQVFTHLNLNEKAFKQVLRDFRQRLQSGFSAALACLSGVRQARCWPLSTAIIWPVTDRASMR